MNIGFSGCSFTYGSELNNHEENRWSRLVCDALGAKELNYGYPGASNDEICKKTFEATQESNHDFFVIQITSSIRFSVALGGEPQSVGPLQKNKNEFSNLLSKLFFSKYEQSDELVWQNLMRWKIICLHHYLNSINTKHMFVFLNDSDRLYMKNNTLSTGSFKNVCSNIALAEYCFVSGFPLGPNKHPLETGHQFIAKDVVLPKLKELL